MVGQNKSWEEVLLQEREENSRLRQQRRDQEERERRLAQRLLQLKDQQQALHEGKAVDAVGRDGKIKALQVARKPPHGGYKRVLVVRAAKDRLVTPMPTSCLRTFSGPRWLHRQTVHSRARCLRDAARQVG